MSVGYRKRFQILERDHFMCLYCGNRPPYVELEVDHVVSRANGGGDEPTNLITACLPCNQGKKTKSIERCEFCVRPLCGGPQNPRDDLESKCHCSCHLCPRCITSECPGAKEGGVCTNPDAIVSEQELFHDVSTEEGFTF